MDDLAPKVGKRLAGALAVVTAASIGWRLCGPGEAPAVLPAAPLAPLNAVQPTVLRAVEGLEDTPSPLDSGSVKPVSLEHALAAPPGALEAQLAPVTPETFRR